MNRPRLSLGLESTRPTLDGVVCGQLGLELKAARLAKGLDIREIAPRLLLSPRQVRGLEDADCEAFYSADFYVAALRKYDALLELGSPLVDSVLVQPEPRPAASATALVTNRLERIRGVAAFLVARLDPVRARAASMAAGVDWTRGKAAPLAAAGGVLLLVVLGGFLLSFGLSRDNSSDPPRPSGVPSLQHLMLNELPPAPTPVKLMAPASASPAEEFGHVSVGRTTWVFVRYQDNSVVEHVLSPGERLVLRSAPIYLAVGEAPGAEIVIVGQPIDTTRFNVNGQLRIGSAFLSTALRR